MNRHPTAEEATHRTTAGIATAATTTFVKRSTNSCCYCNFHKTFYQQLLLLQPS